MIFVKQKGKQFRVGIRDGWLMVSHHFQGRLRPAFAVMMTGSLDDSELEYVCSKLDLAELVRQELLTQIRKAG